MNMKAALTSRQTTASAVAILLAVLAGIAARFVELDAGTLETVDSFVSATIGLAAASGLFGARDAGVTDQDAGLRP